MDSEAAYGCDCDDESDGDYEGAFTVELQAELFALMLTFLDAGWTYLEAGEDAFGIVAGGELYTNRDVGDE